jgi:hypothetical protein
MRKLLFVCLLCVGLVGCHEAGNVCIEQPIKISSDGIKYKVVEIENCKFIATQTYGGIWTFAGPISCEGK